MRLKTRFEIKSNAGSGFLPDDDNTWVVFRNERRLPKVFIDKADARRYVKSTFDVVEENWDVLVTEQDKDIQTVDDLIRVLKSFDPHDRIWWYENDPMVVRKIEAKHNHLDGVFLFEKESEFICEFDGSKIDEAIRNWVSTDGPKEFVDSNTET